MKEFIIDTQIHDFTEKLRDINNLSNMYNQYMSFRELNNLRVYLTYIKQFHPQNLCVGEAAGFHGCRMTGIPFTSEEILFSSDLYIPILSHLCFNRARMMKESTASMIYSQLTEKLFHNIIFWNIVPYHPFKEDNIEQNRTPTQEEIRLCSVFTIFLDQIFNFEHIYGIGKKSYNELKVLFPYRKIEYIRHPSHGGFKEFSTQIKKIGYVSDLDEDRNEEEEYEGGVTEEEDEENFWLYGGR